MINGFFRIAFTGNAGSGFGVIALQDGKIAGADVGGALYDGTYTEVPTNGHINIDVTMTAPAGITPVQTGVPLTAPARFPITAILREADIVSQQPILLQTPLGPVNIVFSKIRDV